MKFGISAFAVLFVLLVTGCDKTDVENQLNQERQDQEPLTPAEEEILREQDPEFQEDYLEEITNAMEEARLNEDIDLANELMDADDNKRIGKNVKGSCNSIDDASTCIEYYGSFWKKDVIKMGCNGVGTFSESPCPDDMVGGCNTGIGTVSDMVAWMYLRGGGDLDEEGLKYAKMACDATLASKWILRQ